MITPRALLNIVEKALEAAIREIRAGKLELLDEEHRKSVDEARTVEALHTGKWPGMDKDGRSL